VLSLELPKSYANFMLEDDDNWKVYVFSSMLRLETIFGPIQYKFAKGKQSARILEQLRT
jgi:hypothetical protein